MAGLSIQSDQLTCYWYYLQPTSATSLTLHMAKYWLSNKINIYYPHMLSWCHPKRRSLGCYNFTLKMEVVRLSEMSVIQNTSTWCDHPEICSTSASKIWNNLQEKINACEGVYYILCVCPVATVWLQNVTWIRSRSLFSWTPNTGGNGSRWRWLLQRSLRESLIAPRKQP
jgi:hypothetical protein